MDIQRRSYFAFRSLLGFKNVARRREGIGMRYRSIFFTKLSSNYIMIYSLLKTYREDSRRWTRQPLSHLLYIAKRGRKRNDTTKDIFIILSSFLKIKKNVFFTCWEWISTTAKHFLIEHHVFYQQ